MQLVPVRIANPPSRGDVAAPPEVEQTLRRSCYDCHSNQTQWPWYTRIAPLSWLVAHDVNAGRRQINFSQWSDYFPATRAKTEVDGSRVARGGDAAMAVPRDASVLAAWTGRSRSASTMDCGGAGGR